MEVHCVIKFLHQQGKAVEQIRDVIYVRQKSSHEFAMLHFSQQIHDVIHVRQISYHEFALFSNCKNVIM